MASEASKKSKPAVRKTVKKTTTRGKASSQKKVATKKPKRKGFVAPKALSIYDLHPMRKYFELLLYDCYTGRAVDFSLGKSINYLDSVKVNKTQLQKKIKLKKELIEVRKYMSAQIMYDNHPDQKILMWDYLRNAKLPTSIDLKYHFVPEKIAIILRTSQQRKVIEGYTALGANPDEIADVLNRNKELLAVTAEEVEVYQYFFWNLDSRGIMAVYPVQVLADYILQTKAKVLQNYRDIIAALEKLSGPLDDERRNEITGVIYINTPYYQSDSEFEYKLWSNVVFGKEMAPLDSFRTIVAVSNGDVSPAKLNRMVDVSDYSALTFDQQVQELSQKFVNAAEAAIGDSVDKAIRYVRGGVLPIAQAMLLLNIPSKSAGKNLKDTAKVHAAKVSDLKLNAGKGKPIEIDVDKDKARRIEKMQESITEDAEFRDIPTNGDVAKS